MTAPEIPQLREPANLVCPRARWLWLAGGVGEAVLLAALQVGWWFIDQRGSRTPHIIVAVVLGVLALAYLVVMPIWRYRVHRWEVTSSAVYTQTGWISQERRIAPLSRVQTVDLTRGPIAQLLRLSFQVLAILASSVMLVQILNVNQKILFYLQDYPHYFLNLFGRNQIQELHY